MAPGARGPAADSLRLPLLRTLNIDHNIGKGWPSAGTGIFFATLPLVLLGEDAISAFTGRFWKINQPAAIAVELQWPSVVWGACFALRWKNEREYQEAEDDSNPPRSFLGK